MEPEGSLPHSQSKVLIGAIPLCYSIFIQYLGISCTFGYILYIWVYLSCTFGCILYIWVYLVHLGVSCTFGCILYIWVYLVHLGISCTFGCILYIWVYLVHLGVSCTFGCILYIWVYLVLCFICTLIVLNCFVMCVCVCGLCNVCVSW
jgi:hypothetical protein